MALLLQSAEWIRDTALARLRGSRDLVNLATEEGTPIWRLVNAFAQEVRKVVVDFVAYSNTSIIPTKSAGIWLQRWMTAFGLTPIEETKWVGLVGLQASGAATPAFAAGLQLTFAGDSTIYQTTDAVLAGDWAGGACSKAAESVTLGTVANKANGTALVVTAPPAGLLATATLGATTTEATDAETEVAQQVRLGNRLSGFPASGNCAHYRQWVLEAISTNYGGHSNEAEDCAVYPRWDDAGAVHGTVTIALFGPQGYPASDREVSAACIADVQAYVDAQRPPGAVVTVESIVGTPHGLGLEVEVRPKPGYEPDWYGPVVDFNVTGSVVGTRRVNLDADPTTYIFPGDRVILYCGADSAAEQEWVESVGANYIILREWPENGTPVIGTDVLEGGPLWQPVYDAIMELHDGLGPMTSTTASKQRWPIEEVERPSTVFLSELYYCVNAIEGVDSSDWNAPAADVTMTGAAAAAITMRVAHPAIFIAWPAP